MIRLLTVFFISIVLGILETTVLAYPLVFLWVICFSVVNEGKESLGLAFLSGLWLDFLKAGTWGEMSLFFLIFSLVVGLYKIKFKVVHPLYFFPFVLVSILVFSFWEFGEIGVFRVVGSLVAAVGLFLLVRGLRRDEKEIEISGQSRA